MATSNHHPRPRRELVLQRQHSATEDRVSAHARRLLPLHRAIHGPEDRRAARPAHGRHVGRQQHAVGPQHDDRLSQRFPGLVQADAGHGLVLRIRRVTQRARSVQLPTALAHRRRLLSESELPVPDVTSLEAQLLAERLAKQRQYVLTNTRARWGFVGFGIALLAAVKLAGITTTSWWFSLAFAASFALANAAVRRLVLRGSFEPWYPQLNLVVGCLLI